MIKVFCDKRGTGKTKALIAMANNEVMASKGNIVYIDDDKRAIYDLHNKIRFVATEDYNIDSFDEFYGFLCGIICKDYDIDSVFIDGLLNIIKDEVSNGEKLFKRIEKLSREANIDFYININSDDLKLPTFIKKYDKLAVC